MLFMCVSTYDGSVCKHARCLCFCSHMIADRVFTSTGVGLATCELRTSTMLAAKKCGKKASGFLL